jgi:hypothetical protein
VHPCKCARSVATVIAGTLQVFHRLVVKKFPTL